MKIYLASRFSRRAELASYRDQLQAAGVATITSRWLHDPDNWTNEEATPEIALLCAEQDVEDVASADVVLVFTGDPSNPRPTSGGHHVEFGLALAMNKKVVLIGDRENVFHWLPSVGQFQTFDDFLYAIEVERGLAQLLGAA